MSPQKFSAATTRTTPVSTPDDVLPQAASGASNTTTTSGTHPR